MDEKYQTSDVKALSGGERSFVAVSLFLAIVKSLETHFCLMDEFDVFSINEATAEIPSKTERFDNNLTK